VLNVAAHTGKPDLVTRVLDILPVLSVQPEEHHLVALMEAYVNAGQVPQALQVLSMIRSVGLTPTRHTAQPILGVLTTPELVDQAFFAMEDMKSQGQTIDVTAFNVLVEASSRLKDVQRVRATQLAASDLEVVPNIDTFNSALAVCIPSSHRALGDIILKEMKDAGVSPNGLTYHNMILLCLTQPKYDDAFFYLETSKSEGFKPMLEAYRQIAIKCTYAKDPRFPQDQEGTERRSGDRGDGKRRTNGGRDFSLRRNDNGNRDNGNRGHRPEGDRGTRQPVPRPVNAE
jgi:hypothetical protein